MKTTAKMTIELNKGYFGLGKLISLDRVQQEDLLKVSDLVVNYTKRKKHSRPLNIYLEAFPGSGKSFFVKQVIASAKELIGENRIVAKTFNLTNIKSITEIIDAFRLIQSINIEGKVPIVFFDEVDYPINNEFCSYPFFLAPMFDGKIYDSGNEYNIGSAVLFFAASKKIADVVGWKNEAVENENSSNENKIPKSYKEWSENEKKKLKAILLNWNINKNSEKLPMKVKDFLDRIDEFVFLPPANVIPNGDEDDLLQQSTLIAAAFINKHFPDVELIDSVALTILAQEIINHDSYRDLDTIIFNSIPPNESYYRVINLPYDFRQDNEEDIKKIGELKPNITLQLNT